MRVLGLNHSIDAAAALFEADRIVRASAEERLSRIKHDSSFPAKAMAFALEDLPGGLLDCDAVAFFWNPVRHMDAGNRRFTSVPRHHIEFLHSVPNHLLAGNPLTDVPYARLTVPRSAGKDLDLYYVTHHLCHAAHAFFESPFEESAILTVDGYGERSSVTIGMGRGNEIKPLLEIPSPHSVGSVYAAITQFLGFKPNSGEGKVMGLASYGTPRYLDFFKELLQCTAEGFEVDIRYFSYMSDGLARYNSRLVEKLGEPRAPESAIEERHQDIAASLQAATEDVMVHLAKLTREKTQMKNLSMAGGVVLNCVANARIVEEAGFERCFFQPACNDAGSSAGAALYVAHQIHGLPRKVHPGKTDYLGPEYSADEIRRVLQNAGVSFSDVGQSGAIAAECLAQGRIIGSFQGRAEYGPRALGNRSIHAQPGPGKNKDILNARVKFREPFRPFAPSVLEESCGRYFGVETPSPYMLRVYKTLEEHKDALGAVTHVDGGARVQTVNEIQNPLYHRMISAYGSETGVDCVLNTSFNIRGEPIVNSPQDALKCFFTTDMDDLFVGPYHLKK